MPAYDVQRVRRIGEEWRQNSPTDHRMSHDVLVLRRRQGATLVEHLLTHPDVADIVHLATELDLPDQHLSDPELLGDPDRVRRHAHRMAARIWIFCFERFRE